MKPFGTYSPNRSTQRKIDWCQKLPASWLSKQVAQLLRKQVINNNQMPLDVTINKVKLRCFLTDNVSERGFVFMPWRWDTVERQVMQKALPAEGVMLDIGANVGIYAAIAATQLNRLGTIVAIEPNPKVHQRLTFNMSATTDDMAEQPRIEIIKQGVSDSAGEFEFYLDDRNLGASSLLNHADKNNAITVSCQTLLTLIDQLKLSRVDVIKCDIEGAEDRALMPFLLDAPHHLLPHCIIFENNQDQWQGDLLTIIEKRDYIQTHKTRLNYIYQQQQPIHIRHRKKTFESTATVAI